MAAMFAKLAGKAVSAARNPALRKAVSGSASKWKGVLSNPKLKGMMKNPKLKGMMKNPNLKGMMKNPKLKGMMNNPKLRGRVSQMSQMVADNVSDYAGDSGMADYDDGIPNYQDPNYVPQGSSGGTSFSTYLLFGVIVFLLIGVILLVAAQSKCAADPNGDTCKNHRSWGIGFTVVCSILLVAILYFKFKG